MSTAQVSTQLTPATASPTGPVVPLPTPDTQIDEIVRRLERRYSRKQISHADLESQVRGSYHQFDAARIRTFVPVFVERGVRQSVDGHTVHTGHTAAALAA